MFELLAKIRKEKPKALRKKGLLPAVLYGPKIKKSLSLELDYKAFEKAYQQAGESSLLKLLIKDEPKKEYQVLIHEVQKDPLTGKFLHVDFYQPLTGRRN